MSPAEFIDNPNWDTFLSEMTGAPRTRHLPTHEDCARLDIEAVARHLRCGGTLGFREGYEERPGQIDMCGSVTRAFNEREHLMIEAGTGVGKSLAYLIPAVQWAWTNDTPVVISTATRNLQSQLISSDIPKALETLPSEASGKFRVALLKGRANYVCLRAVAEFFAPGFWTMSPTEQELIPGFIRFLKTTPDGDLDPYEGLPRNLLTCPGEECSGRHCAYYSRCFVYKARHAAAEAHLIVINHALALAEATSAGGGILPNYGWLVLDEAHNLENIATEYLSREFSLPALTRILNRLIRRGRNKHSRPGGLLASVERQFQKGTFASCGIGEQVLRLLKDASSQTVRIVNAAESLADVAALLLMPVVERSLCRYRVRETREHSLHGIFKPYESEMWRESDLLAAQSAFDAELAALANLLHALRDALDEATPENELNCLGDLSVQCTGVAESLVAFANETNFVLKADQETHTYWAERIRPENRPSFIRLVAAPLSVANDLRRLLFAVKDSVILASATLRVGNDFKYMARRLGAVSETTSDTCETNRFQFKTAASPFDYFRQALVLAPDCLPDPTADATHYAKVLSELLRDLFTATNGRALVLFTSYEMMRTVAMSARCMLEEAGLKLFVQGEGLSREAMTRHLKENWNTVLFGASSFWEGVDVAGEALSCVVLARIPFAQVGDPVIEARSEKIDRDGGSSFRDYTLPEAVIKFRQGFGRLIRTKSDRGVVIVTDPRLVTKNYGAVFRKSIPATVHTVTGIDELLERIREFFASP